MADLRIVHNHTDGTLVYGTRKGDGVYELIGPKSWYGFRWMPSIRLLGVYGSKGRDARRDLIDAAADLLRQVGHTVTVEIDDTPRPQSQDFNDQERRADQADERRDRLDEHAGRLVATADAQQQQSHDLTGGTLAVQPNGRRVAS